MVPPETGGFSQMGLEEAITAIEAADTMDELRSSLHRVIQDYGFSGFAFIDAGRPELDIPYHTGTYPPAWERAYIQNDPIRRWCGCGGPTRRFIGATSNCPNASGESGRRN